MILFPALKISDRVIKGNRDDSHNSLGARLSIGNPAEHQRGFTPDGQLFLSRTQAIGFLKKHDRSAFNNLPDGYQNGLHTQHLATAYGIVQSDKAKSIRKTSLENTPVQPKSTDIDLSTKTAIVYDRGGLYLYCAEKLAEKYKKVMYFLADADAYPTSQKHTIGAGIPNIKRIHDFWKYLDQADIVYMFDCYDGQLQHWLRGKGYKVFGSGLGEQVEIDKIRFLELLEEKGLPCPKTYVAEGLDDLCEYLKSNDGETLFLKNLHRGDFESRKFTSMAQSRPFLNDLKKRIGSSSDTIEVLVQHKIDAECEVGYDGYQVDGIYTNNCIIGYEIKDKGFVAKVFDRTPEIVKGINDAFSDTFKKLGYRGNYSTEIRITKDRSPYYIDATCRVPSPPGELMCEIYENWAEATYQIACGEVPVLIPKAKYGVVIILTSSWYNEHELHIKFPKKYKENVKLKNHTIRDGEIYCVPNGNGEFFGAVITYGDKIEDCIKQAEEIVEEIEADEMEYAEGLFHEACEQIEKGEQFGINFN